jgi:hypothetical protein
MISTQELLNLIKLLLPAWLVVASLGLKQTHIWGWMGGFSAIRPLTHEKMSV